MTDVKHKVNLFVTTDPKRRGDKKIKIHAEGIPGSIWIHSYSDMERFSRLWISAIKGWPMETIEVLDLCT